MGFWCEAGGTRPRSCFGIVGGAGALSTDPLAWAWDGRPAEPEARDGPA
jgi:hypothetical protein